MDLKISGNLVGSVLYLIISLWLISMQPLYLPSAYICYKNRNFLLKLAESNLSKNKSKFT